MKKPLLLFFFIGTMCMIVVMTKTGATLKTAAAPLGILNLELAYNTIKTIAITNSWSEGNGVDNIAAAKTNTYYDFLFLFFYVGFLFLACKNLAVIHKSKIGFIIAKGAILAGLFDVFENIGMLITLNNQGSNYIAACTTFFSILKWGLVIIAILYVLFALIALTYKKVAKYC